MSDSPGAVEPLRLDASGRLMSRSFLVSTALTHLREVFTPVRPSSLPSVRTLACGYAKFAVAYLKLESNVLPTAQEGPAAQLLLLQMLALARCGTSVATG